MTTIKIQRNIYLDYLRGLSALAVMLFHYTTRYDMLFGHTGGYPLYFKYGSYGVLVFFLLSGYLTLGRIDNVRKSPRKFLYKRFLRLYPTFWIVMICTAILTYFFLPELSVSVKDFFLNLTMVPMYLGAKNIDGAYWTLSCELAFYLFVWLIGISRIKTKSAIFLWFVIQAIIVALPENGVGFSVINKVNDLLYFHCFMVGGIIFLLEQKISGRETRKQDIVEYFVLTTMYVFFVSQQFLSHELPSGVFMIVAVVLLILSILLYNKSLFLSNSITKMLEPLVWFAIISYPFYLLHQNIGFVIIRWLESVGFASEFWLIIPFALITGLACLLHKYVEKPMSSLPRN